MNRQTRRQQMKICEIITTLCCYKNRATRRHTTSPFFTITYPSKKRISDQSKQQYKVDIKRSTLRNRKIGNN